MTAHMLLLANAPDDWQAGSASSPEEHNVLLRLGRLHPGPTPASWSTVRPCTGSTRRRPCGFGVGS